MSLRHPTVAFLLFIFDISHVCDVAQTSDGGILVTYFGYKPFMWCCSDARLWPVIIYYFPTRRHPDPRLVPLFLSFGFREDYRPTFSASYFVPVTFLLEYSYAFMLAFVIS